MNILTYVSKLENDGLILECSDHRKLFLHDWNELINALLKPCSMALVYNIDNFVKDISSLFPNILRIQLLEKADRVYLDYATKLFYSIGHLLSITYNENRDNEINFYGLSRYSDTEPKNPTELKELAIKVIEAYKVFGIDNPKLSSPVSAFSDKLLDLNFPRAGDLPSSALNLIDKSAQIMTSCEWRQTYKLGHWLEDEITDMDLVSAYPSIMATLPDISNAKFFESKTLPQDYSFGILQGDLNVVNDVSPFVSEDGIYRKGLHKDYLITTGQLWFLNRSGGTFDMKYGWFLKLPPKYKHPFQQTMQSLFKARNTDNIIEKKIAKGASVGIWGLLCQRYDNGKGGWKLGKHFNSILGLMTSSKCSTKVGYFIYGNNLQDKVISITVDGVLIAVKDFPIMNTGEMGTWKKNEKSPFLVLSQLYQWGNDKKPNGLHYPEMLELIKSNPKKSVYGDIDMNLLERDRVWDKLPRNGQELLENKYNSRPIDIVCTV